MKAGNFVLGALLLSTIAASAQETAIPKVEVGLNYSWLHVNSANFDYQRTGNGGSGYFEYNVSRVLGLVADFGGYANTRTGINDKALTYLFALVSICAILRAGHRICSSCSVAFTRGAAPTIRSKHRTHSRPRPAEVWTST